MRSRVSGGVDEEWRPIEGYPNYEVSSHGRVRSWIGQGGTRRLLEPLLKAPQANARNYQSVNLSFKGRKKTHSVHVLVALAFIGPRPEGFQVAHNDGDPSNNHLSNLRWATVSGNSADRAGHGTLLYGEATSYFKLTSAEVAAIRRRFRAGERQADLAREFGVTSGHLSAVVHVKQRRHDGKAA